MSTMWTGVCCGGRCRSTPPWVWLRLPSPVLGSLRAAGSTARLVFLTVHDEEELIVAARNAGGYRVRAEVAPLGGSRGGGTRGTSRKTVPVIARLLNTSPARITPSFTARGRGMARPAHLRARYVRRTFQARDVVVATVSGGLFTCSMRHSQRGSTLPG